jgi:hypothetical protein
MATYERLPCESWKEERSALSPALMYQRIVTPKPRKRMSERGGGFDYVKMRERSGVSTFDTRSLNSKGKKDNREDGDKINAK